MNNQKNLMIRGKLSIFILSFFFLMSLVVAQTQNGYNNCKIYGNCVDDPTAESSETNWTNVSGNYLLVDGTNADSPINLKNVIVDNKLQFVNNTDDEVYQLRTGGSNLNTFLFEKADGTDLMTYLSKFNFYDDVKFNENNLEDISDITLIDSGTAGSRVNINWQNETGTAYARISAHTEDDAGSNQAHWQVYTTNSTGSMKSRFDIDARVDEPRAEFKNTDLYVFMDDGSYRPSLEVRNTGSVAPLLISFNETNVICNGTYGGSMYFDDDTKQIYMCDDTNWLSMVGGLGDNNPFDQSLNTTDDVFFEDTTILGFLDVVKKYSTTGKYIGIYSNTSLFYNTGFFNINHIDNLFEVKYSGDTQYGTTTNLFGLKSDVSHEGDSLNAQTFNSFGLYAILDYDGTWTHSQATQFGVYSDLYGDYSTSSATKYGFLTKIKGNSSVAYGMYISAIEDAFAGHGIYDISGHDWTLDSDNQNIILGENADFKISYDGTNPYFDYDNTTEVAYFVGNLSAENIIDRSIYWDSNLGDALDNLASSETINNNDSNLNNFDQITYNIIDENNYIIKQEIVEYCMNITNNGTVSENCQPHSYEIQNNLTEQEIQEYNIVFYEKYQEYKEFGTKKETGRLISASVGKHEEAFVELRSALDVSELNTSQNALEIDYAIVEDLAMASKGYRQTKTDTEIIKDLKKNHYDDEGNLNYSSYDDLNKKIKEKKYTVNPDGTVTEFWEDKDVIDLLEYIGKLELSQAIIRDELCDKNKNAYSWCIQ